MEAHVQSAMPLYFRCHRLAATLTPAQCRLNRDRCEHMVSQLDWPDLAAEEVTAATKPKEGHKTRERNKVLTEMAREGVEKYIDAQKKLLNLAIHELESAGKAAEKAVEQEPPTSFAELTQKSVHNFVAAEKALMDLAVKPMKGAMRETPKAANRPRRKKTA